MLQQWIIFLLRGSSYQLFGDFSHMIQKIQVFIGFN